MWEWIQFLVLLWALGASGLILIGGLFVGFFVYYPEGSNIAQRKRMKDYAKNLLIAIFWPLFFLFVLTLLPVRLGQYIRRAVHWTVNLFLDEREAD